MDLARGVLMTVAAVAMLPEQGRIAGKAPAPSTYDWPAWGNDAGGQRYSPLEQINCGNVASLKRAWTFHTGETSDGTKYPTRSAFECTPVVLDGRMYITTPFCRVVALDPESGKELWAFDPGLD